MRGFFCAATFFFFTSGFQIQLGNMHATKTRIKKERATAGSVSGRKTKPDETGRGRNEGNRPGLIHGGKGEGFYYFWQNSHRIWYNWTKVDLCRWVKSRLGPHGQFLPKDFVKSCKVSKKILILLSFPPLSFNLVTEIDWNRWSASANATGSCETSTKSNESLRIARGGLRSGAKSGKREEMVSKLYQSVLHQRFSLLWVSVSLKHLETILLEKSQTRDRRAKKGWRTNEWIRLDEALVSSHHRVCIHLLKKKEQTWEARPWLKEQKNGLAELFFFSKSSVLVGNFCSILSSTAMDQSVSHNQLNCDGKCAAVNQRMSFP